MFGAEDTIVAIASPTTPAIRGIVRLSGHDVLSILRTVDVALPSSKRPQVMETSIDLGEPLGAMETSVMLWPTHHSYTGQPSAEIHSHGCLPILQAIVNRLTGAGARAARPGEFTLRAFLAGRLDLTQAEAVLGVIEAEQRGSLDHALRQLAGNLSRPLEQMRSDLLNLLADVEAGLDFVDEDIQFIEDSVLRERLLATNEIIKQTRERLRTRASSSAEPIIALRGNPNAGKSHLVNALSNQQAAIVADVAGTTRDTVSVQTLIANRLVQLIDTAGIEQAAEDDAISAASQDHANQASRSADVRLWCVDASKSGLAAERHRLAPYANEGKRSVFDLWVATKTDLVTNPIKQPNTDDWVYTSAVSGEGIEELKQRIDQCLTQSDHEETGSVIGTAARCSQSLGLAEQAIVSAMELVDMGDGHEFIAAELRIAVESLGEVTGAVYTDDILDRVFGRFCIGK
ncbi:tRNA modification GTPase MnmE [Planctomycetes bacterium CA13]|uniref:tRNA modification GTPase MnmE n=1 Tax=Novipirellula herctigrandis TaxID=2527986 RepID=A0A5C5YNV5_9BACT|nr:tRNA modification GTPase MnmE [Planctomycetes bacterium CA13]